MANLQRESLAEQLSAVMDGEASELELQRVLKQAATDTELRVTWARYQTVSSLLRQQPVEPLLSLALADRVAQALQDENEKPEMSPAAAEGGWSLSMKRFAVAASVAVVVIAGAQLQQSRSTSPMQAASVAAPPERAVANPDMSLFALSTINAEQTPPMMLAGKPINASVHMNQRQAAQIERYLSYPLERTVPDTTRGMLPLAPARIQEKR